MATALGNFSCDGPSIVLVHIGKVLPSYLTTAVKQARLFNDCPIILIANEEAISQSSGSLGSYHVTCVSCESLKKTTEHQTFIQNSKLDKTFRNGFWNNATERFFYLQDLMEQYQLHDVVHLENDVMLYVDILSLIPLFKKTGMHVGLTLDNDERCIPGFVYIADSKSMTRLASSICSQLLKGVSDMYSLGAYYHQCKEPYAVALPIIMDSYVRNHPMVNVFKNQVAKNKFLFCKYASDFRSIFDAAALGQYLGGIDPRNGPSKPGFVNESCVFNPSFLTFFWKTDDQNRKVPFAQYGDTICRINNLHIHSKHLDAFLSDR